MRKSIFLLLVPLFVLLWVWHTNTVSTNKYSAINCLNGFTDNRDGQIYSLVKIGDQCWMRDTLKIGKIKALNARNETNVLEDLYLPANDNVIEKYCEAESAENCKNTIGYYYTWDEAMGYSTKEKSQGICPTGWHIPSEEDWNYVEDKLGRQQGFTPEKDINDYFNFVYGSQWEWTSTSSEVELGEKKYRSVRAHRIAGDNRGDRFGSTVRENKYYVRCLLDS